MQRIVRLCLVATVAVAVNAGLGARADVINITEYAANQADGGLNIKADYDVDAIKGTCPPENLRYLQRVLLTDDMGKPKPLLPEFPNANFIDPQPDQGGPGSFDTDPWYDATYDTAADRDANDDRKFGAGRFYRDDPSGFKNDGPLIFSAITVIVCIDATTCRFEILGGFTWGFSVAADKTITALKADTGVSNDEATRKIFNDALALGPKSFSKWSAVASIPEPSSLALFGLGAAGMRIARSRRNRSPVRAA